MNLFKEAWKSLTFNRHLSSILKNFILGTIGLIAFFIGYFLPQPMMFLWILGVVIFGLFYLIVLYEFFFIFFFSIKAKRKGRKVSGRIIKYEEDKIGRKYRFYVECETPVIEHAYTEPIFWLVDGKVLQYKFIKVIYFGPKKRCIILPN